MDEKDTNNNLAAEGNNAPIQEQSSLSQDPTPTPNPDPAPIVKTFKKKTIGLVITFFILAALLIGGGVFAIQYISWRQSDPIVVYDAVASSMKETRGSFTGTMDIEVNADTQESLGIESIHMSIDGSADGAGTSGKGTLTVATTKGNKADVVISGAFASDGTIYFKIEGIKEAIDDLKLPTETAAIMDHLKDLISDIDGGWYKFTIDDLSLNSDDKNASNCTANQLKSLASADGDKLVNLYKEYPYYIVNKNNGTDSKGNTIYNVSQDANIYAKYVDALKGIEGFDSIASCTPKDLSSEGDYSEINLHVDVDSRELRGMSIKDTEGDFNFRAELFADYDENIKVEIPTDAKPISDLMSSAENAFKNIVAAMLKEQVEDNCAKYPSDAYSNCVSAYSDQIQDYLDNLDFSDLFSIVADSYEV